VRPCDKNRIRNEYVRGSIGVTSIVDKMRENRFRWFGHVISGENSEPVRMAVRLGNGNEH